MNIFSIKEIYSMGNWLKLPPPGPPPPLPPISETTSSPFWVTSTPPPQIKVHARLATLQIKLRKY